MPRDVDGHQGVPRRQSSSCGSDLADDVHLVLDCMALQGLRVCFGPLCQRATTRQAGINAVAHVAAQSHGGGSISRS